MKQRRARVSERIGGPPKQQARPALKSVPAKCANTEHQEEREGVGMAAPSLENQSKTETEGG